MFLQGVHVCLSESCVYICVDVFEAYTHVYLRGAHVCLFQGWVHVYSMGVFAVFARMQMSMCAHTEVCVSRGGRWQKRRGRGTTIR